MSKATQEQLSYQLRVAVDEASARSIIRVLNEHSDDGTFGGHSGVDIASIVEEALGSALAELEMQVTDAVELAITDLTQVISGAFFDGGADLEEAVGQRVAEQLEIVDL